MKLLYIGNFGPEHSTENHVRRAFDLAFAGARDSFPMPVARPFQEGTDSFLDVASIAHDEDCDFVLWTHTHGLAPEHTHGEQAEMLKRCAKRGIPTVAFHLDRWWGLDREHQLRDHPYFHCDLVITADGGHQDEFAKLGINHVWMPPAVSAAECEPARAKRDYAADVAFVGSWQGGYHPEWAHREELVRFLRRLGTSFWPRKGEPAIRGEELRRLYASTKVNVGDSCLAGGATHYWSDRIPETLGRGGFLLHPTVLGLGEHFVDGEHLVTWHPGAWADLQDKIGYYIKNDEERQAIAAAGRAHVLKHHTYECRSRAIVDLVKAL